ncbi:MAG: glycosyltransferase [Verrucomicrobiaceae bacterium]
MKVCVASPYSLDDPKGNTVTTVRIVEILKEAGIDARGRHGFDGEPADVLIVLHAAKGASALARYRAEFPEGKVILLLTGTDLYQDIPAGSEAGLGSMTAADCIVVMHEAAVASVPEEFTWKTRVINTSLSPVFPKAEVVRPPWAISIIGHLRPVKNPFAVIEAVSRHPEWAEVEVWQIGGALDEAMEKEAIEWGRRDGRYRWFGQVVREEALTLCARSSLTVNSSHHEGGANSVLEAMTMGVPVLGSRIEGNVGLLGEGYPGLYDPGDLEERLSEIVSGSVDLTEWVEAANTRLSQFTREHEQACWLELLEELTYPKKSR